MPGGTAGSAGLGQVITMDRLAHELELHLAGMQANQPCCRGSAYTAGYRCTCKQVCLSSGCSAGANVMVMLQDVPPAGLLCVHAVLLLC